MVSQNYGSNGIWKKDSRIDMLANGVEKLSTHGITKTELMNKLNTSFVQLNGKKGSNEENDGILHQLLLCQLIDEEGVIYRANDRGKSFLRNYKIMRSFLTPEESPKYEGSINSLMVILNDQKNNGKHKNRTFYDIYSQCIKNSVGGKKKTDIMKRANLNSLQFEKYNHNLILFGLWVEEGGKYFATEKGMEFLGAYNKVDGYLRKPSIDSVSIPKTFD